MGSSCIRAWHRRSSSSVQSSSASVATAPNLCWPPAGRSSISPSQHIAPGFSSPNSRTVFCRLDPHQTSAQTVTAVLAHGPPPEKPPLSSAVAPETQPRGLFAATTARRSRSRCRSGTSSWSAQPGRSATRSGEPSSRPAGARCSLRRACRGEAPGLARPLTWRSAALAAREARTGWASAPRKGQASRRRATR